MTGRYISELLSILGNIWVSYSEWCYGYTDTVVVERSVPVLGI